MAVFPPFTFRKHPLKALFLTYELAATLFRIPIWFFLALSPSFRPRDSWPIRRTVQINLIRTMMSWSYHIGRLGILATPTNYHHLEVSNGVEGEWIEPVPKSLIQGEIAILADIASVEPIRLPGYWHKKDKTIDPLSPSQPNERVLLFLHGGAYIRLSAHPNDPTSNIPKGLLECTNLTRALSVEYRLSSTDPYTRNAPFPTALIDALSGYCHLVNRGFSPSNIIVAGDSAGGNLALALTRYLVEEKGKIDGLPSPPGRLLLFSPWVDLWDQSQTPDSSLIANTSSDYVDAGHQPGYPQLAFTGPHGLGMACTNRYISPASLQWSLVYSVKFKGFPPTFINVGGAEILYDQIIRLKERMVRDLGEEKVTFYNAVDGCHDYLVFPWFEPERSETLQAIKEWLN